MNPDCVVIVLDIYVYTCHEEYNKIVDYCDVIAQYCTADHPYRMASVFQTGDVTNNNQPWQWENAWSNFFSYFSEVDYPVFCLGNYNYGSNGIKDTRTSNIPVKMNPRAVLSMPESDYDNYVRFIDFNSKQYAVLVLEFALRNEV